MNFWSNLGPLIPELFLLAAGMIGLMIGVFCKEERASRVVSLFTYVSLAVAFVLLFLVGPGKAEAFGGMFVTDRFVLFTKFLVVAASLLVLIVSRRFLVDHGIDRFEFPVLVIFAVAGMMIMVSAGNLISFYMGLELQSLSLYVIAAFQRDNLRSTEAGLKYFVLGALASGLLLYGASLVYGVTGSTDFGVIATAVGEATGTASIISIVGLGFILTALAFKVSLVPFHMWTPDVYEGAPTPVTAFFALAPKIAGVALFVRVMVGPFAELAVDWQTIIVAVSALSMILGSFAALVQTNIKRLMAYSSIGHMGYALMGLAVAGSGQPELQVEGIQSILIYLTIYMFMTLGTFICILYMRVEGRNVEEMSALAGLGKSNPILGGALTALMFSMAGIPPLAGFFAKLYVFRAAYDAGLIWLLIIAVLTSVVAAYYYLRIVKIMYFDDLEEPLAEPDSHSMNVILSAASIVVLFFILFQSPVIEAAAAAASAVIGG